MEETFENKCDKLEREEYYYFKLFARLYRALLSFLPYHSVPLRFAMRMLVLGKYFDRTYSC